MNLTTILDDCLQRLAAGESVTQCLSRYPEAAPELAPMLVAAEQLRAFSGARLSQGQRLRAKVALREELAAQGTRRSRAALPLGIVWPQWRLAPLAALVAVVLFSTVAFSAVAASQPGDLTYPVRVAVERAPVWFHSSAGGRVTAELALADRRLDEVTRDGAAHSVALDALLRSDAAAIARAGSLPAEQQAEVMARVAQHADELEQLAASAANPETSAALQQAAGEAATLASRLVVVVALPTEAPAATAAAIPTQSPTPTPTSGPSDTPLPVVVAPTLTATPPPAPDIPTVVVPTAPTVSIPATPDFTRTPLPGSTHWPTATNTAHWTSTPTVTPFATRTPLRTPFRTRTPNITVTVPPIPTIPTVMVPTVRPIPTIPTVIVPTVRPIPTGIATQGAETPIVVPTFIAPTVVVPTFTVPTITVPTITVPTVVVPTVGVPPTVRPPGAQLTATVVWLTLTPGPTPTPRPDIRLTVTLTVSLPRNTRTPEPTQTPLPAPTSTPNPTATQAGQVGPTSTIEAIPTAMSEPTPTLPPMPR